jgi:hypothetical protein
MTWDLWLYSPSVGRHAADFYSPGLGLNLQTLGPVASMLTITPPSRLSFLLKGCLLLCLLSTVRDFVMADV